MKRLRVLIVDGYSVRLLAYRDLQRDCVDVLWVGNKGFILCDFVQHIVILLESAWPLPEASYVQYNTPCFGEH